MSQLPEVRVERRVQAPPGAVWEVVTDLERAPERLSQITELRLLTDGPYAVGTRWRETRRMLGVAETQEMSVVENEPARRTLVEAQAEGTRYRTEITLQPLDDGTATQLAVSFSALQSGDRSRLQRLALRVVGPLGARLTERTLRTELDDIAAAAERLTRG